MTSVKPPASGVPASDLEREIEELAHLDLAELRVRWRKLMRSAAPKNLPRSLLVRVLAYKLQARVFGGLDPETIRYLTRVERERVRRRDAGEKRRPKDPPPVPPVPDPRPHKAGTLFVREHAGVLHAVTVTPDGFAWRGTTYKSLSEIAREITGTRWSGPRFFGLRERPDAKNDSAGEGRAR